MKCIFNLKAALFIGFNALLSMPNVSNVPDDLAWEFLSFF